MFRHLVERAGLAERFEIDSAGTSAYHVGDPPDERTAEVALARGITLSGRARQITREDFRNLAEAIELINLEFGAIHPTAQRPRLEGVFGK